MARAPLSVEAALMRSQFNPFVRHAFRMTHGVILGDQPYVDHMCYVISQLIDGKINRLLINLPPQHLKSFVGTICLAAYLLGTNPRLRIIVTAYNDPFAEFLCGKIRNMMQTPWYQQAFATRIKEGHSRANDFATREDGDVFAVAATEAITGRTADFIIYDDPHEIGDWNNDRNSPSSEKISIRSFPVCKTSQTVRSWLSLIRVNEDDLSAVLLQERRWTAPSFAVGGHQEKNFRTRTRSMDPRKGRRRCDREPTPAAEIERLQRTQVAPPFELFYQQGAGLPAATETPDRDIFRLLRSHERRSVP